MSGRADRNYFGPVPGSASVADNESIAVWPYPQSGLLYQTNAGSVYTGIANRVQGVRFSPLKTRTITQATINVGTVGAAGHILCVAFYTTDGNTKLVELATNFDLTLLGVQTQLFAAPFTLTQGQEICFVWAATANTALCVPQATVTFASAVWNMFQPSVRNAWFTGANSMAAGVMPTTIGAETSLQGNRGIILLS